KPTFEVRTSLRDKIQPPLDLVHIRSKLDGARSPLLLIDLGTRRDSGWPWNRRVEHDPFQNGRLEKARIRTHSPFPGRHAKRVGQMTNHLMGGQPSPSRLTVRAHSAQPFLKFESIGGSGAGLHGG